MLKFNFLGRKIERGGTELNNIRFTVGGSGTVPPGAPLEFEAPAIYLFQGPIEFLDTTSEASCDGQTNDPCQLYASGTNAQVCLKCPPNPPSNTIMWKYDPRGTPSIKCDSLATDLAPKSSFYNSHTYYTCDPQKYPVNGVCTSCHSSFYNCFGGSNTKCLSCQWSKTSLLNGSNRCKTTCALPQSSHFGVCSTCPAGCSNCNKGKCDGVSCSGSEFLFMDQQVCCDIGNQKYLAGSACSDCHPSCESCYGSSSQECLTCAPGYAMDYAKGSCVASCDAKNGKFFDGSQCRDCPVGCKECVSSTVCKVCDSSKNYVLEADYSCSFCPTTKKKFMNTENHPPTCDSCETGCLECSDANTCTKCDGPGGFYLSSGDCLTCSLSSAKFVPASGDSCQDCNTANCLECSDGNTCTKCSQNSGIYLNSGKCLNCDISNGKYITSTTPQRCEDCNPNCLSCSQSTENSGTCLAYKKSNCGEKCWLCSGTSQNECQTCLPGVCQSIKGNCLDCPQGPHQASDPDSIVENSALTFSFAPLSLNNLEEYKLTFSQQEIVFEELDLYDLKSHLKVKKSIKKFKKFNFLG